MNIRTTLAGVFLALGASAAADDPAAFVDPFVGTAGNGHTFPAACRPLGLVQAGPDTGNQGWERCSGYVHTDGGIAGFTQTHLNGTGCPDLGDVRLLPFLGDAVAESLAFRHEDETAAPGFYAVKLDGGRVSVEVAAAEHAAIYRIAYAGEGRRRLLVDAQWGIGGNQKKRVLKAAVAVDGTSGVSGEVRVKRWVERTYAFAVAFDRPFASVLKLPRRGKEKAPRYAFDFDLGPGETLTVKVGLSRKSADAARRNLADEIPGWDLGAVRDAARRDWNALLARAAVEGTEAEKRNWYTSVYHLYVQPNNVADAGEKPFYSTFSCWDTFRAAGPLYTILTPDRAADFVDSMLEQGRITGYLPIWTLWGVENQCMIGTHSIPMIVDAYLKGTWAGDAEAAYRQVRETLTKGHKGRKKENWDLYDRYGYYPFDRIKGESVSRTLECAYDDWCAAQMAKKLGRDEDAAFFLKRAGYWKNVLDPSLGLMRGRDTKGNWRPDFNPYRLAGDFTEGNSFQYTWHVMQDPQGLVAAIGGREKFAARLDSLFTRPSRAKGMGEVKDVSGLIGQYVHGNEPSHHVIYFYPQIGEPDKAADRIREVFDRFYLPKPDGLCGNDDCGQMSAWYLFSAMGFYPFNPCGGEYVLGAPQVPKVTLNLAGGKTFTVLAKNLSRENRHVKSVTLNGKPVAGWKIRHADVMSGGELVFEMGK